MFEKLGRPAPSVFVVSSKDCCSAIQNSKRLLFCLKRRSPKVKLFCSAFAIQFKKEIINHIALFHPFFFAGIFPDACCIGLISPILYKKAKKVKILPQTLGPPEQGVVHRASIKPCQTSWT